VELKRIQSGISIDGEKSKRAKGKDVENVKGKSKLRFQATGFQIMSYRKDEVLSGIQSLSVRPVMWIQASIMRLSLKRLDPVKPPQQLASSLSGTPATSGFPGRQKVSKLRK
jgi:hypothetical protein